MQLVRCGFGSIGARGLQPRAAPHDRRNPRESRRVSAVAGREPPAAVARDAGEAPRAGGRVAAPAPADEDESDAGEPADEDSVAAPAPAPADADESDDEEYAWPAGAPRGAALIGRRIRIWWPHDRAWFSGSVNAFDGTKLYEVTYTDGSLWDEDLAERRWELLDESALKAHEREFLRVERLRLAGKASHKNSVDGGIYRRFYELTGTTGQTPWKQKLLRERTRLIIEPFLDAPVADAAGESAAAASAAKARGAGRRRGVGGSVSRRTSGVLAVERLDRSGRIEQTPGWRQARYTHVSTSSQARLLASGTKGKVARPGARGHCTILRR